MYTDIIEAIEAYIEYMGDDYAAFYRAGFGKDKDESAIKEKREDFLSTFEYRIGRKYIKVVGDGCVKAFIVNTDNDKKFRRGDLLKPATFNSPTRNFARGNVIEGEFYGGWYGA